MPEKSPRRPSRPSEPAPRRRTDRTPRREDPVKPRAAAPPRSGLSPLTHGAALAAGLVIGVALGWVLAPGAKEPPASNDPVAAERPAQPAGPSGDPARGLPDEVTVKCLRVLDGDTLEAEGFDKKVRYLGIDSPEMFEHYYAKEAYERNRALVEGRTIRLVFDGSRTDDLGRNLAYVYVGDVFANEELLKGGYARISPHRNTKLIREYERFLELEAAAREAGRGLWNETARDRWETSFLPEEAYECSGTSGGTVHRPSCRHAESAATVRIESLEEAMRKRKACSYCRPTRNHPTLDTKEESR